jgi:hypothetical protein
VQQAPSHISVSVAIERNNEGPRNLGRGHKLWRVTRDSSPPEWQLVQERWIPKRVLMPPQRFSQDSPLGVLLSIVSTRRDMDLERRGLHSLALESYVRYPAATGIQCPNPMCGIVFNKREVWARHLLESLHGRLRCSWNSENQLQCSENTPLDVQAALAARSKRILSRHRDADRMQWQLENDWKHKGTEKRRAFEEAFRKQLREESVFEPGKLVEAKCTWIDRMENILDPVSEYHF